jgi:hypothetical protein
MSPRLRIKDIDFDYGQIIVRDGKGEKDCITVLPQSFHAPLDVATHQGIEIFH